MNKKIIALLTAVLLLVVSILPVCATSSNPLLVDNSDVLTDAQEVELSARLNELRDKYQFDFVVVTTDTFDGYTAQAYADDYFDYNGYGYGVDRDGSLFLIGVYEDYRYISTSGYGITAFTDAGIQYIGSQIVSDIQSGNYYEAIDEYIDLCDDFLAQANKGRAYDVNNLPRGPFKFFKNLLISLAVGFGLSLIVVLIMKSQLKSVRSQAAASSYVKANSMNVTLAREFFLYRHVDRQKKADNNSGGSSTHTSSSGRTHGGGGF